MWRLRQARLEAEVDKHQRSIAEHQTAKEEASRTVRRRRTPRPGPAPSCETRGKGAASSFALADVIYGSKGAATCEADAGTAGRWTSCAATWRRWQRTRRGWRVSLGRWRRAWCEGHLVPITQSASKGQVAGPCPAQRVALALGGGWHAGLGTQDWGQCCCGMDRESPVA